MHQYNKLDNASLNFPLCFVAFFPSAQGRFSQYFIPPVPQIMHAINAAVYLLAGFPRPFTLLFSQLEVFSVLPHQLLHTQLSALHTVHCVTRSPPPRDSRDSRNLIDSRDLRDSIDFVRAEEDQLSQGPSVQWLGGGSADG